MGENPISISDVKKYNKQMEEVYSSTQFGYMFRITVTRYVKAQGKFCCNFHVGKMFDRL